MILDKYLEQIKTQVATQTGTTVQHISVDSDDTWMLISVTLFDTHLLHTHVVSFEIQRIWLDQYSDEYITNSIVSGLLNEYSDSLKSVSTIH